MHHIFYKLSIASTKVKCQLLIVQESFFRLLLSVYYTIKKGRNFNMSSSLIKVTERIPILDGMRYFYSKTETCNFVPRMEITMADPVILPLLQLAAEKSLDRYRVFRLVVKSDDAQHFLVYNERPPIVHIDNNERHIIGCDENNGHLIWIGASDKTIIFDFFHGISDGHGALPFVSFLLRYYCNLRYGSNVAFDTADDIMLKASTECMESLSFLDKLHEYPQAQSTPTAFQLPEEQMDNGYTCSKYSLTVDAAAFDNYMRKNRSSRTSVFILFMNHAIASIHPQFNPQIVAGVGADVRHIYAAEKTMRDCSDLLSICYDHAIESMPITEQLQLIRQMIIDSMHPDVRLANAFNTKLKNTYVAEKFPLLKDKIRFCQRMHQYGKYRYTYNISCVGRISFGSDIDTYVDGIEWGLSANTLPVSIVIIQYKEAYHIVYYTHLKSDPYVHKLQEQFLQAGIPCTCKKQQDFEETLAIF